MNKFQIIKSILFPKKNFLANIHITLTGEDLAINIRGNGQYAEQMKKLARTIQELVSEKKL